jgi:hypothetical protein
MFSHYRSSDSSTAFAPKETGFASAMANQQQDLTTSFQVAVSGLSATISTLQEEVGKTTENGGKKASRFASKARVVWNDNVFKELFQQIRDQRASIGFPIDCIQT